MMAENEERLTHIHICESFAYGAANSIVKLAELALKRDESVHILYGRRLGTSNSLREVPQGVTLVELPGKGKLKHISNIIFVSDYIKKLNKMRYVHAHSSYAGLYSRILKSLNNETIIYSPRGYAFLRKDYGFLERAMFRFVELYLAKKSITHACGKYESSIASELCKDVFCIPNSIDTDARANIDQVGSYIFGAGRICHQKGFDTFCEVASLNLEIKFKWAGEVDENGAKYIKNLPKNVELLGKLDRNKMETYIREARAILLPSRWEGMSRFLIESLSFGKAIITSDFPGNKDALHGIGSFNHKNGYSCSNIDEYCEAVRRIYGNEKDLLLMQESSLQLARAEYSQFKNDKKWNLLYEIIPLTAKGSILARYHEVVEAC